MRDFLRGLLARGRRTTGPEAEEIKALSDQFRVTLKAAVSKIEETPESREILARISARLEKEEWHWKDAYEVEQQVVLLYDRETLRTELSRRTLEARSVLYPDVAAWYQERTRLVKTVEAQRALLLRLVNDLQWRYTVNEAKLGYVKQITGRTGWIFISAVIIFVAYLLLLFVGGSKSTEWTSWNDYVGFLTFLLAAVSGYLGASFSMVAGLKARLESSGLNQMKNASSRAILLSRVLVGTGAAMILYFFFESNLLAGEAFPDLTDAGGTGEAGASVVRRALLIVWCFIAGFSEKLVPGLLAKTEAQLSDQVQTLAHRSASPEVPVPSEPGPAKRSDPGTAAAPDPTTEGTGTKGDEHPG